MSASSLPAPASPGAADPVRARALKRLKKRRDLLGHLIVYVLINGFLTVLWFTTSPRGFFWPGLLMGFWGIGLVMNAWDVWRGTEFREDQIEREIRRMQRHP